MTSSSVRRVGIMSPGDMGGATGKVLADAGFEVYTCLAGRSELTRRIAAESGFRDLPDMDALVTRVDLVVSILVPDQAVALAERVAESMRRTGARPPFVECNAIAPQTVRRIESIIAAAGGLLIDGGIIGGPPRAGSSPRYYCSGPDTSAFEALRSSGLDIRRIGDGIGQASGLKMVYAASTKGTTALWTELLVAARVLGLQEALMAEFGADGGRARAQMSGIPSMPRRARRWIGEMEEIAATFEHLGLTPRILLGAADMYRLVAGTRLADQTSRDPNPTLEDVLEELAGQLGVAAG